MTTKMTRRCALGVLLAGLMFVSGASAGAHTRFRIIGTIVKMDTAKKLLTVKPADKKLPAELEIDVTPKSRIEKDGKKQTAAALKPGAFVVVDALGDDIFATEATLIRLVPPPAK